MVVNIYKKLVHNFTDFRIFNPFSNPDQNLKKKLFSQLDNWWVKFDRIYNIQYITKSLNLQGMRLSEKDQQIY